MQLYLEILDGEQAGKRIPLRHGYVIGRKGSDLTLRDSKISSRHAEVQLLGENWLLVDLGSANGIKTEAGRVRELPLVIGASFILGNTSIKITADHKDTASSSHPHSFDARSGRAADGNATPPDLDEEPTAPPRPQWQETVLRLVREAGTLPARQVDIARFDPLFRLKITSGIQMGTEWLIGYGPRDIGAHSTDLALDEPGLPPVCFSLLPQHKGILFKTDHSDYVRLNGKALESEFLRDGDLIQVQNTRIEVVFEHDE